MGGLVGLPGDEVVRALYTNAPPLRALEVDHLLVDRALEKGLVRFHEGPGTPPCLVPCQVTRLAQRYVAEVESAHKRSESVARGSFVALWDPYQAIAEVAGRQVKVLSRSLPRTSLDPEVWTILTMSSDGRLRTRALALERGARVYAELLGYALWDAEVAAAADAARKRAEREAFEARQAELRTLWEETP